MPHCHEIMRIHRPKNVRSFVRIAVCFSVTERQQRPGTLSAITLQCAAQLWSIAIAGRVVNFVSLFSRFEECIFYDLILGSKILSAMSEQDFSPLNARV